MISDFKISRFQISKFLIPHSTPWTASCLAVTQSVSIE